MTIAEALKQANEKLKPKIDNALTKEVFEAVRETEAAVIPDVVYGAYQPVIYQRRGQYEGLGDTYNIEIAGGAARGGVLTVVNTTEPNHGGVIDRDRVTTDKNLPLLVERGQGAGGAYDFPRRGRGYMKPRPFTDKTIEALMITREHVEALKDGLRRQGVKIIK